MSKSNIEKVIEEIFLNEADGGAKTFFGKKIRQSFTKVLAAGLAVFSVAPVVQNFVPQVGAAGSLKDKGSKGLKNSENKNSKKQRKSDIKKPNFQFNVQKYSSKESNQLADFIKRNPVKCIAGTLLAVVLIRAGIHKIRQAPSSNEKEVHRNTSIGKIDDKTAEELFKEFQSKSASFPSAGDPEYSSKLKKYLIDVGEFLLFVCSKAEEYNDIILRSACDDAKKYGDSDMEIFFDLVSKFQESSKRFFNFFKNEKFNCLLDCKDQFSTVYTLKELKNEKEFDIYGDSESENADRMKAKDKILKGYRLAIEKICNELKITNLKDLMNLLDLS